MSTKKFKFIDKCETEDLTAVFETTGLNCSLADYVLRQMAYELMERGVRSEAIRRAIVGPERCPHDRSTMGTCGECDDRDDDRDAERAERDTDETLDWLSPPLNGQEYLASQKEINAETLSEAFRLDFENKDAQDSLKFVIKEAVTAAMKWLVDGNLDQLRALNNGLSKTVESSVMFDQIEKLRALQQNALQIQTFRTNLRKFEQTVAARKDKC